MDICQLPSVAVSVSAEQSRRADKLASQWASGEDAEESLWWIAFASQLPTQRFPSGSEPQAEAEAGSKGGEEKMMGHPALLASQAEAQRMVGEVDGHRWVCASRGVCCECDDHAVMEPFSSHHIASLLNPDCLAQADARRCEGLVASEGPTAADTCILVRAEEQGDTDRSCL